MSRAGEGPRRRVLPAPVGPWACYIILRDHGLALREKAAALEAVGRVEQGRDVRQSLEWMRQAADQLMGSHAPSPAPACSGVGTGYVAGLSTREAARRLGLTSSRQVINLIGGRLEGRKVRGAWVIDAATVQAEVERRGRKSVGSDG